MRVLKRRDNETEADFESLAVVKGYSVSKRGWPDFMCFRDGRFIAVEVKPRTKKGKWTPLKDEQAVVLALLQRKGVECFLSDGGEVEPFVAAKHLPRVVQRAATKTSNTFVLSVLLSGELGWPIDQETTHRIERRLAQLQWVSP